MQSCIQPVVTRAITVQPARAPAALLQRKCACGGTPGVDGECAACRARRLQRQPAGRSAPAEAPPVVQQVLRSSGQPLAADARVLMEQGFGRDFSQVRVHTDALAAQSAHAVNALAYTVGRHIVFGTGQYAPELPAGRRLLAHELAHVVQQSGLNQAIQRQAEDELSPEDAEKQRPSGPSTIESSTDEEETNEAAVEDQFLGRDQEETLQAATMANAAPAAAKASGGMNSEYWRLEREADSAATSIAYGQQASVQVGSARSLHFALQRYASTICDRPSTQFPDFPATYISHIDVNLASPNHDVSVTWSGPNAARGQTGPFHSSPGAGCCGLDCNDVATSRTNNSRCTPKVSNAVIHTQACAMRSYPEATNVSYFDRSGIALHYYPSVPNRPASHGCVRLGLGAARLIYDNARVNVTTVTVGGTWTRGRNGKCWRC